jgi:hypothetical protein
MAALLLLTALGAIVVYHAWARYRGLSRNIAEAQKSGLPFVVTPWSIYSVLWLASYYMWLPLLKQLPASWHGTWLEWVLSSCSL